MQKTTSLDLFRSDITFFTYVWHIGTVILVLITFSCDLSFAQVKDLFKPIDGVAIWGSIGGLYHNEIKTRNAFLRYGAELLLGPFPDSPKTVCPSYEFGLGVNFADGYRTSIGDIDVRMPIRTIYIAAYLEFQKPCWLHPYVGSKIGTNFDLKGTTLDATASTDTSNLFELTGNTIPIEILVGGWWEPAEGFNIIIEISHEYLAFDGIVYKELGTSILPAKRPRRIDLSGWYLTFGFQLAK